MSGDITWPEQWGSRYLGIQHRQAYGCKRHQPENAHSDTDAYRPGTPCAVVELRQAVGTASAVVESRQAITRDEQVPRLAGDDGKRSLLAAGWQP